MYTVRRFRSPFIFLVVAAGVYSVAFYVRGILATVDSPEMLAGAVVVDMVILVPAAYYFFVVRRFGLPVVSVAGIFVLSLIAATQIIPDEQQRILRPVEILASVAELSILSFIVWKAVCGVRRFRVVAAKQQEGDAFTAIKGAARQVIDSDRVADIFAFEIAVLYYALGSWRRRPVEGPGRYTSYKRNNLGPTLSGIGLLLVVELVAVHLLVQHYWSVTGAWVLSILSAYAGIWLLGEWHAHRLRPTVITTSALVLRSGIRWEVTIPFTWIQSFRRISAIEEKPRGTLNLVALGDALFEVTTNAPVEAYGAYGIRKVTERVWFAIDDPEDFQRELSEQLQSTATTSPD